MSFIRGHIPDLAALAGGVLITIGIAMIYAPAAYIAAGVMLVGAAVLASRS